MMWQTLDCRHDFRGEKVYVGSEVAYAAPMQMISAGANTVQVKCPGIIVTKIKLIESNGKIIRFTLENGFQSFQQEEGWLYPIYKLA